MSATQQLPSGTDCLNVHFVISICRTYMVGQTIVQTCLFLAHHGLYASKYKITASLLLFLKFRTSQMQLPLLSLLSRSVFSITPCPVGGI